MSTIEGLIARAREHLKVFAIAGECEALDLIKRLTNELESLQKALQSAQQRVEKLEKAGNVSRTALQHWIDFHQESFPTNEEQQEEIGEQFTLVWTETEQAIKLATEALENENASDTPATP